MKNAYQLECNIAQTLNIIGDKWSLLILHEILMGNHSYNQIKEALKDIPTNLLSQRLKELEQNELIISSLYQEHPPRYEYKLTNKGWDLKDIFYSMMKWGEKHLGEKCYKKMLHQECGGEIEIKYHCKKCNKQLEKEEIEVKSIK